MARMFFIFYHNPKRKGVVPMPWQYFLFPADQAVIFLTATQQGVAAKQAIAVTEYIFRSACFRRRWSPR